MPTNFTKHTNYAKGELQSDITASSVSFVLTLGEGSKFPTTGLGNIFRGAIWGADFINPEEDATRELFTAYRESGDTFRFVLRGAENTTARDWLATSNIALVISSAKLDEIESAINTVEGDVDTAVTDLNSHINNENNPHATSLSQLEDANIDTPTNGQALIWNGTKWINDTIEGSGDVIGDSNSQDNDIVLFQGSSGKVIKSSNKIISSGGLDNSASKVAVNSEVKTYVDNIVVGLWDDRGSYDASGNTFPATGGSGTAGAILKGDIWTISVAGTLGGVAVGIGDTVRAVTDNPEQTASNWALLENNIGYVPENNANKVISISALSTDTEYASAKCIFDELALKQNALSKATGSDIDTGTDNDKYVTSKAIADSKIVLADKQTSGNILRTPKTGIFASGSTTYQKTDATVTTNSLIDLYAQGTTIGQWEVESFAGYFIITSTETETSNVNFFYFINNI